MITEIESVPVINNIEQLKVYLRVDHDDDDHIIKMVIDESVSAIEYMLNMHIAKKRLAYNALANDVYREADRWKIKINHNIKITKVCVDGQETSDFEHVNEANISYIYIAHHANAQKFFVEFSVGYENIPNDMMLLIYMMSYDVYHNTSEHAKDIKRILSKYRSARLQCKNCVG